LIFLLFIFAQSFYYSISHFAIQLIFYCQKAVFSFIIIHIIYKKKELSRKMTEKIYDTNPHITQFEATVLSCVPVNDCFAVILDRTAFFPEEGGQGSDSGTLGSLPVLHVSIDKDNTLTHFLPSPLPVGEKVSGTVDWEQRFDYMQQHTGEHILSGLMHKKWGYDNVGFHLSNDYTTLDVNGSISLEDISELEKAANRVIFENLPVKAYFPSPEELSSLSYRSKIEIEGAVRIVEIPGVDLCACCAPHVDTTGQIGLIKITEAVSHRGGMRLTIKCGMRALADYGTDLSVLRLLSNSLSVPFEKIPDAVEHLKQEAFEKQQRINALQEKLLLQSLSSLPSYVETDHAVLFTEPMDVKAVRNAVNTLTASYPGYSALFSGSDDTGYTFIAGGGEAFDCTQLAAILREKLSAKCGGSKKMIQGNVNATKEAILAVLP
jgi:alanyl-tRNA synthetase